MNEILANYICRVCLGETKKTATPLNYIYNNLPIYVLINSIADVNIEENDGMPDIICSQCLAELEVAVSFKEKCEKSNVVLLTSTSDIAVQDEDVQAETSDIKVETSETSDIKLDTTEPEYLYETVLEEDNHSTYEYLDSTQAADCSESEDKSAEDAKPFSVLGQKPLDEKPLSALKKERPFKSKAIDLHLQCDDCKEFFKSKCKLRVHWKNVHVRNQRLICKSCKLIFKSHKAYNNHQKNRSLRCKEAMHFRIEGFGKQRKFYCKECDYTSLCINNMYTHRVTHTGDRPYSCDKCGTTHTQLSSLISHKERAHKEYKTIAPCYYCGKIIKGRKALTHHLNSHKEKSHQCKTCNKVYQSKAILKVHMLRHSTVKTKQCENCEKSFFTQAELCNHKRIVHMNAVKLHGCEICEYTTPRKDAITKHRSRHCGDNVCCMKCGKFFDNLDKLNDHKWLHNIKNLTCHCGQKFKRSDSLRIHMKNKHSTKEVMEEKLSLRKISSSSVRKNRKVKIKKRQKGVSRNRKVLVAVKSESSDSSFEA